MLLKLKEHTLSIVIFIILLNLFWGFTSSLSIAFIIITTQLLCVNRYDSAFMFLLLGSVFGSYFAQKGIHYIGSILMLASAIILLADIRKKISLILPDFLPLLGFFLLIILTILFSSGGDYSSIKFFGMFYNAIVYGIAFLHLVIERKKHSYLKIGVLHVLYCLFLIYYMNELMGTKLSLNSLIFTFADFRTNINDYKLGEDIFTINYQDLGINACIAFIFSLFAEYRKKYSKITYIVFLLSFFVVWYSSARQALLIFALVMVLYFFLYKGLKIRYIAFGACIAFVAYIWINQIDSSSVEFLAGSSEGKDSVRNQIIQEALNQFYTSPLFGVGFGRFYLDNRYGANEHNLFVELLTETGIVGFSVFVLISSVAFTKAWSYMKDNINNFLPLILIFLTYFIRSMISSDLRETIIILVLALIFQSCKKHKLLSI